MSQCFVIKPFDKGGQYDKRYDDVLVPAIKDAGLEPYRVDRDPSATVVIDEIEKRIRESEICLADITMNNPNVWYEVGYALATGKQVILICADPRPDHFRSIFAIVISSHMRPTHRVTLTNSKRRSLIG